MADRMYRPNVDADTGGFPIQDVGHLVSIGGILFVGNGQYYLCMLPGNEIKSSVFEADISYLQPTPEQWEAIVRAADDPQYLDAQRKVWLRKAQRSISGFVQQQIWVRDGFKCMYCGRKMGEVQLTIDHFWPLEMGSLDEPSNYVSACRKCNKEKGKTNPETWCIERGLDFDFLVAYLERSK